MDIEKRIQLEKIYRKRRMIIKGIIAAFSLIFISSFFKNDIPKEIPLKFIFVALFFIFQFQLVFLIRKIPPLLCDSPSFTGEQHFLTLYKSIIVGFVFTLCLTTLFLLLSDFLIQLTIEFVCNAIIFSSIISPFVAFLLLDKKERKKAKLEIENNSKR